jgi:hypothetical protein
MPDLQINFASTEQDFIDTQKTHAWRRYSPAMARFQKAVSPILGLIFIAHGVFVYRRGVVHPAFLPWLEITCGLYVLLATSVIGPWLYRRAYRRRNDGSLHENVISFTEDCVECECKGRSHVRLEWQAIKGSLESPTTFLLYTSPATFLSIPKRAISEDQLQLLIALLRTQKVPAGYPVKRSKNSL